MRDRTQTRKGRDQTRGSLQLELNSYGLKETIRKTWQGSSWHLLQVTRLRIHLLFVSLSLWPSVFYLFKANHIVSGTTLETNYCKIEKLWVQGSLDVAAKRFQVEGYVGKKGMLHYPCTCCQPIVCLTGGQTSSNMRRPLPQACLGNILFLSNNTHQSMLHKHIDSHTIPIQYLSLDE